MAAALDESDLSEASQGEVEPLRGPFVYPRGMELEVHLIHSAQRGDRDAQAVVLRRYAGPLHALVRRSCPGGEVDDLTQALLMHVLTVLPRFNPIGAASLSTWLFTIAHRWLIDRSRKRHLTLAPLTEAERLSDPAPNPEATSAGVQLRGSLEQAIAALPEAQRRLFVLAHVHEQPLPEIAEAEGLPLGTVKSRLFRARAALAEALGDALDDPTPVRSTR